MLKYDWRLPQANNSVRRILKRGVGGQKLRKISEKQRTESEIVPPEISRIFCPKLGEQQKKRSSLKFGPVFRPKTDEVSSLEETLKKYPLCDQTLCSTCKGGGGCHASILLTFLCNFASHGTMAPLNTPLQVNIHIQKILYDVLEQILPHILLMVMKNYICQSCLPLNSRFLTFVCFPLQSLKKQIGLL